MECVTSRLRDGNEIAIILSNATQLPLSRHRSSWEFAKLKLDLIKQTLDAARGSGSVSARALISNKHSCAEMFYAEWWNEQRRYSCKDCYLSVDIYAVFLIQHFLLIYLTERQYELLFLRLRLPFKIYLTFEGVPSAENFKSWKENAVTFLKLGYKFI